ncbi:MAG: hypothetical protein FJW92_02440 [Actinobacteria bacterium]|nr:hypothetical protein [Actinomycetota bacterium]
MSDEPIRLALQNPDIILMQRPESPALVHGRVARDAHPGLAPLWDDADGTKGTARVERRGDDLVATASITAPVEAEMEVVLGLPDALAAGLERRPSALVMIYPDDDARAAGVSDFRTGGVRGDWYVLGIVLPNATTDPLRHGA